MRLVLLILLGAALAAGDSPLAFPRTWEGRKAGTAEGNPRLVKGVPVWRLDRVIPDDPMVGANWKPVTWDGKRWFTSELSMGNEYPYATVDGQLYIRHYTAYDGSEGDKLLMPVFIAPQTGRYGVAGTLVNQRFEGQGPAALLLLRRDAAKEHKRVVELKKIDLPDAAQTGLKEGPFRLEAGQELALLVRCAWRQSGMHLWFRDLEVVAVP